MANVDKNHEIFTAPRKKIKEDALISVPSSVLFVTKLVILTSLSSPYNDAPPAGAAPFPGFLSGEVCRVPASGAACQLPKCSLSSFTSTTIGCVRSSVPESRVLLRSLSSRRCMARFTGRAPKSGS